jgi:hypothetical protein
MAQTYSTMRNVRMDGVVYLSTETVEGAARAFESIDDVERGHGLALGVLSVCDRVTDYLP